MDDLESRIQARKQEAIDKKIAEKALLIADYLGTDKGGAHTFVTGNLTIRYSIASSDSDGVSNSSNLRITMNDDKHGDGSLIYSSGSVVFEAYYPEDNRFINICAYVPGSWEYQLEGPYTTAAIRHTVAQEEYRRNYPAVETH